MGRNRLCASTTNSEKRGQDISQELVDSLKKERLIELAQPEKNQMGWVITGYFFAIIGGFIGVIIGYALWKAKKTLPNGTKVYSYSVRDRKQGQYIFLIGIIILPIVLLLKVLSLIDF
ncbi:MAG: hypothetical protein JKY22_06140 [Flavobacteriaceae bacterium]|nr:hypothetical protein [Flavobacteriaceae bacterium]